MILRGNASLAQWRSSQRIWPLVHSGEEVAVGSGRVNDRYGASACGAAIRPGGPKLAVSRRLGDEIHPWLPNGDLRPVSVVHDSWRESRFSDHKPVVQLRRSVDSHNQISLTRYQVVLLPSDFSDTQDRILWYKLSNCRSRTPGLTLP